MSNINFNELAQSVEELREVIRAMVAGLTTDGFTDEQARGIVAGIFMHGKPKED